MRRAEGYTLRSSSRFALALVVLALIGAACSSGSDETTTSAEVSTTAASTTSEAPSTTEAQSTTTAADATTTTSGDPVDPPNATFAISEIGFGSAGYVEITNISDSDASLDGYWLCQQPSYHQLAGPLAAGESIRFNAADSRFGSLSADGGAMGLYTSGEFGSPDAIAGYVAWGPAGHGRLQVAINGGVWTEGPSVDATGASLIATTEPLPVSAEGWTTG